MQRTFDLAGPGGDLDTLTTSRPNWLRVGDRVRCHTDTNRMRRIVVRLDSSHACSLKLYLRPSKGFRRHIRRAKSGGGEREAAEVDHGIR